MKAIVINLDHRGDRLYQFWKNNDIYLPFYVERFSAVDCLIGEDGCTQSHLKVISSQTEFPFIVFEDDCRMILPWSNVEKAMSQLPEDWDALWLGANPRKPLKKYSENLYRLTDAYCLHAVIYNSKRMVDYIVENHNTTSGNNLDIFYKKEVMKRFNCFITYPIVATQLSDYSDIAHVKTNNDTEIIQNYNKAVSYGI